MGVGSEACVCSYGPGKICSTGEGRRKGLCCEEPGLSLSSEEPSALVPRSKSQTMLPATLSHVKTQAEGPHFPCVLVVVQFPGCGMSPWITAGLAL